MSKTQCPRNKLCISGAGHAGFCTTRQKRDEPMGQDELFASRPNTAEPPSKRRASARNSSGIAAQRIAGMQELARKRNNKGPGRRIAASDDDDDFDDNHSGDDDDDEAGQDDWGGGGVEYADHGMSKSERKAMRAGSGPSSSADAAAGGDSADEEFESWAGSGPAAVLSELESIRLSRATLEKWVVEPFFAKAVRGCLVRIGLQVDVAGGQGASTLYRIAEVLSVDEFPDNPYYLGQRQTSVRMRLQFGEAVQWYPMASISNQSFDDLELRTFQMVSEHHDRHMRLHTTPGAERARVCPPPQVREVAGVPQITTAQLQAKREAITHANNYSYTEEDIRRVVEKNQEKLQKQVAQGSVQLTTRQKLSQQHGGSSVKGAVPHDLVARPMNFSRDKFGKAVVQEQDSV